MSAIFDCFVRILRFRVFSFARIYKDGIKYQFILHETHVRVTIQLIEILSIGEKGAAQLSQNRIRVGDLISLGDLMSHAADLFEN